MVHKRYIALGLFLGTSFCQLIGSSAFSWTKVYHRAVVPADFTAIDHKKIFTFTKENTQPFTQLIMGWNSSRPVKGHFSFYGQLRDKKSGKWGSWHQMADWGKKSQKSYSSKSDGISANHYVRLEMDPNMIADGFKVKVVAKDDANLKNLEGISITLSNFFSFSRENAKKVAEFLPSSVEIGGVPAYSQLQADHPAKKQLCSPTSCAMVIDFITGKKGKSPKQVAKKVYDEGLDAYGSWPFNTAYMYECCKKNYWVFPSRLSSFVQLYNQLKRGLPVVVSVRGDLTNAPQSFSNGHLMVVVGYDKDRDEVLVRDPAFPTAEQTVFRYPLSSFLQAWERSHRLVYWIEPKK